MQLMHSQAATTAKVAPVIWGVHDCLQGSRVYKLGLVMGQHIDIITIYRRHRYRHRFRVRQLRVAVHVVFNAAVQYVLKPNTHRRRRRDETVWSRRVGDVYMNSQLAK